MRHQRVVSLPDHDPSNASPPRSLLRRGCKQFLIGTLLKAQIEVQGVAAGECIQQRLQGRWGWGVRPRLPAVAAQEAPGIKPALHGPQRSWPGKGGGEELVGPPGEVARGAPFSPHSRLRWKREKRGSSTARGIVAVEAVAFMPPAEAEGAADQRPVAADRPIRAHLEVGPAQFLLDLFVPLLDPLA